MAIDVSKAIQNIKQFGCEAGYNSPGMFIVIVPPASEEELTRVVPVSVYELEWISLAEDDEAFKKRLNAVRRTELSKINSAITPDYVTLRTATECA
jgi:hypothetical protein